MVHCLVVKSSPPAYGSRAGWLPRMLEDFGDGGAFPEIHVPQYPLDMGRPNTSNKSKALAVKLDSEGKIKYDVLLKQGKDVNKIIPHKLQDLLPAEMMDCDDQSLHKPDEEEIQQTTERTRKALEALVGSKIQSSLPCRGAEKLAPAQYIRYTPSDATGDHNSGATQRLIRMVEVQKDPMEPPKFRVNAKIPQAPSSPPPPVMHSPPRKITVKEQQEWKIPPCISNWKNAKGYTIPLDKRLAADGRGLQQVHINEKFGKLSEALYIADRKAREGVELRAQMERKRAQKEKEEKEDKLRRLAQKAREERAGIRCTGKQSSSDQSEDSEDEMAEREHMRKDRQRERKRERNFQRAAPEKRSRLERERDISEQIALGLSGNRASGTGEVQFDQRLFNQSKGMSSGFGDDEEYNVYDQAWRSQAAFAQNLYRPTRSKHDDLDDDLDKLASTSRFIPEKGFSGADKHAKRDGPVAFEKATPAASASASSTANDEDDPFGLDKFLTEAKKASKPKNKSHTKYN